MSSHRVRAGTQLSWCTRNRSLAASLASVHCDARGCSSTFCR